MAITLTLGLPEDLRTEAVAIYWQAFGGKLGAVMGPEPKALAFLQRVMRADHAIVAQDQDGALLGIAGFKSPQGSFAGGEYTDLRGVYGVWGAFWRGVLLWLLSRDVDNERFLIDGICVAQAARGQGVGSALVDALCAEGVRRGYTEIRLEVIDSNWRAKTLYERLGFTVLRSESIGMLRFVFGFRAAFTMVKVIALRH